MQDEAARGHHHLHPRLVCSAAAGRGGGRLWVLAELHLGPGQARGQGGGQRALQGGQGAGVPAGEAVPWRISG